MCILCCLIDIFDGMQSNFKPSLAFDHVLHPNNVYKKIRGSYSELHR